MKELINSGVAVGACEAYLADKDVADKTRAVSDALLCALKVVNTGDAAVQKAVKFILDNEEFLCKKSV